MKKNVLKGALLVGFGAAIYGMVATFVKLAYKDGYTTAEVTTSQFSVGIIALLLLNTIQHFTSKKSLPQPTGKEIRQLMLAGTSLGCTSLFYYLSVQYINVSVAIILLMQSVWFSVVVEAVLAKRFPGARKIISVVIVLIGTILATNLMSADINIDVKGIFWGLMAAASYTLTMFTSNTLATHLPVFRKSFYMLSGGAVVIAAFLIFAQIGPLYSDNFRQLYLQFSENTENIRPFRFSILWKYGLVLALLGTITPPILFNIGFPRAGLGLGSIVSSLELPVSVTMAYILLGEKVFPVQWIGILLILSAIIYMNLPQKNAENLT